MTVAVGAQPRSGTPRRIGFLGVGTVGAPVAARLAECGHTIVAYDIDPAAAAAARRKLLTFAAREKLRVAGIHLDFPTFGHVVEWGSAYQFVPDVWRPTP